MILPIVLYGSKTWCLILRKEHRLRVFENGVLRKTFHTKREKMEETGETCIMKSSMIHINQTGWALGTYWEKRTAYRV